MSTDTDTCQNDKQINGAQGEERGRGGDSGTLRQQGAKGGQPRYFLDGLSNLTAPKAPLQKS